MARLSRQAGRRIARAVRIAEGLPPWVAAQRFLGRERPRTATMQVQLFGALAAATDPLTGATTASAERLERDPAGATETPFDLRVIPAVDLITVVNRFETEFAAGTYGWVEWINGEWLWLASGSCPERNEFHHYTIIGSPTGGTLFATLTVNDEAEVLDFAWNATAAQVATELETHTQIASGDVEVTGGPFPNSTIQVHFKQSLAGKAVMLPTFDWGSLTGGSAVAVIASRPQSGFPN